MSNQSAVSEVISALNALYQGTSLQEREQANSWLEQYQKTVSVDIAVPTDYIFLST